MSRTEQSGSRLSKVAQRSRFPLAYLYAWTRTQISEDLDYERTGCTHDVLMPRDTRKPGGDHASPALHGQTQHGHHPIDMRDEDALRETPSVLRSYIRPSRDQSGFRTRGHRWTGFGAGSAVCQRCYRVRRGEACERADYWKQTYSSSTNKPLASVPVSRSSMMPPGLTRRNHLNRCLPSSGMSEVMGYAARTCQSASESETSSWTEVISLHIQGPGPTLRSSGYRISTCGRTERGRNRSRAVLLSWITSKFGSR